MRTAILFLIFNRPDTTFRVFETIRLAKPPRLYVAADGPRKNKIDEREKCEEVRSIIKEVDWDCEVKTLFRDENLGCGKAVSQAITWFFEYEEEGIILEDDILPHPDFFPYCEELLERYRDNVQVQLITGRNGLDSSSSNELYSYYFSALFHMWGWATWRRVWDTYSFDLKYISFSKLDRSMKYYSLESAIKRYWLNIFVIMKYLPGEIDTWDFQLLFNQWFYKRYSIIPLINLIQNIGFDENATHTKNVDVQWKKLKGHSILPLKHPSFLMRLSSTDRENARVFHWEHSIYQTIKSILKNVIKWLRKII